MMTRKNYEAAAEIIRGYHKAGVVPPEIGRAQAAFLRLFKGDNPRFDENRFFKACRPVAQSDGHPCTGPACEMC